MRKNLLKLIFVLLFFTTTSYANFIDTKWKVSNVVGETWFSKSENIIGKHQEQLKHELSCCSPMGCKNIYDAVCECYKNSKEGDLVLLAPGCASTDQFKNFEERGQVFQKAVSEVLS